MAPAPGREPAAGPVVDGLGADPVVYHVYPRSFADASGDGDGDLRGLTARLGHLAWLGVDALWLSPIYPSPRVDNGYDVADLCDVDPRFGTLADLDALVARARGLDLRVLLDLVPCHTSIEHRWFREHPERYVVVRDGEHGATTTRPPTNWASYFGGPAWSRHPDGDGWYLHAFYPEQPALDWARPEVHAAMGEVLAFWRARGIAGFRLDALQQLAHDPELRDDPPAAHPPMVPQHPDHDALEHARSADGPGTGAALATMRAAVGSGTFLVGEVLLPARRLGRYLEHLDAAFCFDLLFAPWEAEALAAALAAAPARSAWALGNHDVPRLATRVGERHAAAAATLLLTLPGPAVLYQGDESGQRDGPPSHAHDRHGRDPCRRPVQRDDGHAGGFTAGTPWLAPVDPAARNVAAQRTDPDSLLRRHRALIALRPALRGPVEDVRATDGVLSFRRGAHLVALNTAEAGRPAPPAGVPLVGEPGPVLAPGGSFVAPAG